jgi:hypothetical protein
MKKLFASLVALVIVASGCSLNAPLSGQNPNQSPVNNQPKQTQSPVSQSSSTEALTSGWSTYDNYTYGFEIKHPGAYQVSDTAKVQGFYEYQITNILNISGKENYIDNSAFTVSADNNSYNMKECLTDDVGASTPVKNLTQIKEINGNTFYIFYDKVGDDAMGGSRGQVSEYRIIHNNYCYILDLSVYWHQVGYAAEIDTGVNDATPQQVADQASAVQKNEDILDEMLASFKFTEPETTPTSSSAGGAYENQYLKINIPAGWTLTEATRSIQNQNYDKTTGKMTNVGAPVIQKTGAINLIKDNYILYINPQAQQASGVIGGRFSEISMGAPSDDAVVKMNPSAPCGSSETSPAFLNYKRVDLYTNDQEKQSWCASPTDGSTIWYFSYITDSRGGYFNYYKDGGALGLVITMAYNSKDVNKLPVKGSAELKAMLGEMTSILQTLVIKPAQAADGNILYTKYDSKTQLSKIYSLDEATGVETCLTPDNYSSSEGVYSPDGKTIAYEKVVPPDTGDIWLMNADGSNQRALTDFGTAANGQFPRWDNDGTKVLFTYSLVASAAETNTIYSVNTDGSDVQVFMDRPNKNGDASMDPLDSNLLAYRHDDGNWQPDETIELRNLTSGTDTVIKGDRGRGPFNLYFGCDGSYLLFSEFSETKPGYWDFQRIDIATQAISTIYHPNDGESVSGNCTSDGRMYFSDYNSLTGSSSIYRSNSDGSNRTLIYSCPNCNLTVTSAK